MDATLQAQFQRVETTLGILVDSIASYNPSLQATVDLLTADDELGRSLDQLARHQANHRRIQTLRAEAEALEEQLKSSVTALANLRRELSETPATIFPEHSRPVPFDELLQFATNISKHTVPPTWREAITPPPTKQDREREEGANAAAANGDGTPAVAVESVATSGALGATAEADDSGGTTKDITAEEAEWLRKLNESSQKWGPWPSDDKIRASNLMRIQYQRDVGGFSADMDLADLADEGQATMEDVNAGVQDKAESPPAKMQPEPRRTLQAPARAPAQFTGYEDMFDDDN